MCAMREWSGCGVDVMDERGGEGGGKAGAGLLMDGRGDEMGGIGGGGLGGWVMDRCWSW